MSLCQQNSNTNLTNVVTKKNFFLMRLTQQENCLWRGVRSEFGLEKKKALKRCNLWEEWLNWTQNLCYKSRQIVSYAMFVSHQWCLHVFEFFFFTFRLFKTEQVFSSVFLFFFICFVCVCMCVLYCFINMSVSVWFLNDYKSPSDRHVDISTHSIGFD